MRFSRFKPAFASAAGHRFLARSIGRRSVVLDLGANHGDFASAIELRFGCSPKLVEANPDLCEKLKKKGHAFVLQCAAASETGTIQFNISKNDEGSSLLALPEKSRYGCTLERSVMVPSLTLEDIMGHFGLSRIDLLKMDIEGAEVSVLETCPESVLKRCSQITVEFHCSENFGFGDRDRAVSQMRRLTSLGFSQYSFTTDYTDVLFVNHASLGTHLPQRVVLELWRFLLNVRMWMPQWVERSLRSMPSAWRACFRRWLGSAVA